jgi:hypothetical protein
MSKDPSAVKKADSSEEFKEAFRKPLGEYTFIGKVTPDKLKLFLDIEPIAKKETEKLPPPDKKEVLALLKEQGISNISNPEILEDMLRETAQFGFAGGRRISRGLSPVTGRDGKVVYLVKRLGTTREVQVDDKGKADFANVHLFDNIEKGQILARIYPPKPGTDGMDVFGKQVTAESGKPANIVWDESIEEGEEEGRPEYRILRSKQTGCLAEEGNKLKIQHELIISGDLDYRFGTLDFIGKVVISGDVLPGFNITARDGIEVKGSVRGGSLVALKGPIKVDGFVYGGKGSRVISGDSFTATIVQEVNAEIRGDITILKEARDSLLRTESTLTISNGHLYGGKTLVVCGADCGTLGSEVETNTIIEFVGDMEATVAYAELQTRIMSHEKAAELLRLHLGPLATNRKRIEFLKPDYKAKITVLVTKLDRIESSLKVLKKRKVDLLASSKSNTVKRINIQKKIYPGVKIVVRDHKFETKSAISGPISIDFDESKQKFIQGELKGLECTYRAEKQTSENTAPTVGDDKDN